jgi:ABC-2 type transport system permease protein
MSLRSHIRVIRSVMAKDIKVALTQRLSIALGVVIPVNYLLLFMLFAISGGQAPTAVVMDDQGPLAQKFLVAMERAHSFQVTEMSAVKADLEMSAGHIVAIVTVPASFDDDLSSGRTVALPVLVNNLQVDFTNDIRRALPMTVTTFYADAYPGQVSVRAQEVDIQAHDTDYIPYLAVSVAVLGLLLAGILLNAQSSAKEHEEATIIELVLSPASEWAIVVGKLLAALAINAISGTVVVAIVVALIGAPPAHPLEVVAFGVLLLTAFGAVGLLLGNLVRRRQAAIPLAIATSLPLFFLSGPFGPINWMGGSTALLAHISPAYYGIAAFQHAFHGYQTAQTSLTEDLVVLAAMAVAAVAAGAATLRPRRA